MKFMGYRRPNGTVGIRNYVAVLPSVFCANSTAKAIAKQVEGAIALRHPVGCTQVGLDFEITARTLIAMGNHPNIAAVVVVGLGCERFKPEELYEGIKASGKPVVKLVIQEEGGTTNTIKKGVAAAKEFARQAANMKRVECDLSELMVATKCGGTDATSGLAANPTVGEACDLLVAQGGSAILSELNELLSTEDMLARRAVNEEVAKKVYSAVYEIEEVLCSAIDERFPGRNQLISPGNFDGGVTTIVEKALGGVHKGGTSQIVDVLDYSVAPREGQKGLFLMKYESQDGEVVTGMIGCGAQLVAFTTGRGNPTGFPFVTVIKITGNQFTYESMKENFDFYAGDIISDGVTVQEKGKELLEMMIRIANGELTTAEKICGNELFVVARR
ncbi:MAG: UxaA family hydrolase [Negativicutes bacterium]|nr:UxaA family hydrolase [Negativicutes bacterium]